jgi:hypothetical protein
MLTAPYTQGFQNQQPAMDRSGLLRRAFFNQYNLILLGGAGAFSLALASYVPVIAAGVAEVFWMAIGAATPWWRGVVERQQLRELQAHHADTRNVAAAGLAPHYAARLKALEGLSREIRRLVIDRGLDPSPLDREGRGLDAMLLVFVKIATLHQQLDQFAGAGSVGQVEQELMRLGQALADEKDMSVRLTLRQALTLGQRRLKQHEQIDSQRRALGIKLSTLEMSFDYLRSHVFGGSSAEELALALDELAAGASFLPAAEAEVQASIAKLQNPVTRTVTGTYPVPGKVADNG